MANERVERTCSRPRNSRSPLIFTITVSSSDNRIRSNGSSTVVLATSNPPDIIHSSLSKTIRTLPTTSLPLLPTPSPPFDSHNSRHLLTNSDLKLPPKEHTDTSGDKSKQLRLHPISKTKLSTPTVLRSSSDVHTTFSSPPSLTPTNAQPPISAKPRGTID